MPESTKEQPTGRDLDAAVAERVMGWRRNPDYKNIEVPILDMAFEWYVSGYGSNDLPRYSESIEAAMRVVEKMRELGRVVRMQAWRIGEWAVSFSKYTKPDYAMVETEWGYGDTLPEAICRAAYAAIGSKE